MVKWLAEEMTKHKGELQQALLCKEALKACGKGKGKPASPAY